METSGQETAAAPSVLRGNLYGLMDAIAYLSVAAGYLLGILTARHLTVPAFLVFSALNLGWVLIFRYLSSPACADDQVMRPLVALVVLAAAAQLSVVIGLGFDWLIPVVTVSLLTLMLSWHEALIGGALLLAATLAALVWIDTGNWQAISASLLTLATVYPFVVAFSYAVRRQQEMRARAEALTEEVSHAKAELEEANTQLRRFSAEVEELAVTRERNRMAREIHDTLGHYLTILAVQLETATKLEERGDPRLGAELVEARRVASECLAEVRRSVAALRPADLAGTSLAAALRRLVGELEAAAPDVEVTLDVEGADDELSPELRVALYRSAQEALTNVRKHAHASKVLLRLRVEPAAVELTVLDNGDAEAGADGHTAARTPGFGLVGMRERVALLGGSVVAGAEPERGWRVEVRVPREVTPSPAASGAAVGRGAPRK